MLGRGALPQVDGASSWAVIPAQRTCEEIRRLRMAGSREATLNREPSPAGLGTAPLPYESRTLS